MSGFNDAVITGPGDRIAPFELPPFPHGNPIGYRPGRTTVLSFCALWCVTWKEQASRLGRVQQALAGLPIDYITISVDGRWAERYAPSGNASGRVLLDTAGTFSARLGVRAVPYTFVVDPSGVVRFARQGIIRADELVNVLRPIATGRNPSSTIDRSVYLTFDDFPAYQPAAPTRPSDDELLLDILRSSGVTATFFCIGEHLQAPAARAVAIRALREGHSLQLHSWSHDARDPQLDRCVRAITALAPDLPQPTLYRPPGHSELCRLDGRPIAPQPFTVNPYDFARPGEAELTRRVLQAVRPGGVILLHAGVAETRDALPRLIAALRRQDLRFRLLSADTAITA